MAKSYTLDKGFRVDRGWEYALRSLPAEDFHKVFWLLFDYQMTGGLTDGMYMEANAVVRSVVSLIVPQIESRLEGAAGGKLAQQKRAAQRTSFLPEPVPAPEGGTEGGCAPECEGGTLPKTVQNKTLQDISDDDIRGGGEQSSGSSSEKADFSDEEAAETLRLYGELCPSLAPSPAITAELCTQIRQARQKWTTPQLRELFTRAEGTPFLRGGGEKGWRASLPWLLKNGDRVLRGEFSPYSPPSPPKPESSSFETDEFFQAALRRSYG